MTKTIKIIESSLQAAVIEYIELRDRLQCHVHLRVNQDGECYAAEDVGYTTFAGDNIKTLRHEQCHGRRELPDDWQQTEQSMEITAIIGYITEDLTLDGYDIEWIPPAQSKEQVYDQQIHPLVQKIRKLAFQHQIPYFLLFGLNNTGKVAMAHDQRDQCEPPDILVAITTLFLAGAEQGQDLTETDPLRN